MDANDGAQAAEQLRQANGLRDQRLWDAAIQAYGAYLSARPDDWRARIQLGHCLKEQGDPAAALLAYREAEAASPGTADTHLQIGHALKLLGDGEKAWRSYARALELDPANEDAAREASALARLASPLAPRARAPGQAVQLVFDTSDLVAYLAHNRTPTGIQRVQLNVTARALLDPVEGAATAAVAFHPAAGAWREIGQDLFLRLWRLSRIGGDVAAPDWVAALADLRAAIEAGPDFAFAPGASLVNLGTSWWIKDYFLHVRHAARRHGVRYVPMIHDCIPLMAPEHCPPALVEEFAQWFSTMVAEADGALANSAWSAADARRLATHVVPGRELPVRVVRLDADLRQDLAGAAADGWPARSDLPEPGEPFVLCVGTIESRKNHLMLFQAWLELIRRHGMDRVPRLVCIGKPGWLADAAVQLRQNSEVLRERVLVAHGIPDVTLAALYQAAIFTVTNSHYEGWGLPVTESLSFGRVPVVSRNTFLVEAGGEAAVYFEPRSEPDLLAQLERLLFDGAERARLERRIAETTRLRSWGEIADQIMRDVMALRDLDNAGGESRLALEPGVTCPVRLVGGGAPARGKAMAEMLREGLNWHPLEAWGAWTAPGVARLRLALAGAAPAGPLRVYLGCVAPAQDVVIGLRAYAAGSPVPRFRKVAADGHSRFTCVLDVSGEGTEILVEIDGGAGVPVGTRRKPDPRLAGLGVTAVMACGAADIAARLDFLERQALRVIDPD